MGNVGIKIGTYQVLKLVESRFFSKVVFAVQFSIFKCSQNLHKEKVKEARTFGNRFVRDSKKKSYISRDTSEVTEK